MSFNLTNSSFIKNSNSQISIMNNTSFYDLNETIKAIKFLERNEFINITEKLNDFQTTILIKDELMISSVMLKTKLVLYIITILTSLIANILIIVVIFSDKTLRSKPTNYFIINLAVCDLAIVFVCAWVQILSTSNSYWVLSLTYCKIKSYLQMVSEIASVFTLTLIAYDRYIGNFSKKYFNFVNSKI
jgi:hypothetical protein